VAPSRGELITTSVDELGVGPGEAGGLAVDEPPAELLPFVAVPLELLPELELAPGAGEAPALPALGLVVPEEPTEDTFAFVELSADFV